MATLKSTNPSSNNENAKKYTALQPKIQNTKRPALSTINENIQARTFGNQKVFTKPGTTNVTSVASRNAAFPIKPDQKFAIFKDDQDENIPHVHSKEPSLPETVTRLYRAESDKKLSVSFEDASCGEQTDESCMLVDTTFETSNEAVDPKDLSDYTYADDIYNHLRELELKFRPHSNYIQKQPDISSVMRKILVDWLVEVTEEYKMKTETLYHAVAYTDRFLSIMSVQRLKLQLVGTASMFIASKYEEIYPPELKEFVYITDDSYSNRQVLRMEHLILKVLQFDLGAPTAYTFLRHFYWIAEPPKKVFHLAEYICELSLLEVDPFLSFLPSIIAAASLCLANCTLHQEPWGKELQEKTGYKLEDFKTCMHCLHWLYSAATTNSQQAIRRKYRSSSYHCVAAIPAPERLILPKESEKLEKL